MLLIALNFIKKYWHFTVPVAIFLLVIIGFGIEKACNRPRKLDEKAIQKAQTAIAKQDREQMINILAESDTKEDAIDSNIKAIENATEQSKKNYTGKSNDELAAELNRRAREQ